MFSWLKKNKVTPAPEASAPEVLGLRLGGAIELDDLKFRLMEPVLAIEQASRTQIIKAVGEVELDTQTRLVRFYTDDDGYFQVLQSGTNDADVTEVKLFYFYESKPVDTESAWNDWIDNKIVQPQWDLDGMTYEKVWDNTKPVAMTEKTWAEDGSTSTTDQFIMVYEREAGDDIFESLLVSGEEIISSGRAEHAIVLSTGIPLTPTDFSVAG
ncbi:YjfK family protein [Enterovibrio calviensis]|uniref:YjfK family protein n=1 Tax=Enterovibrio calviensis TaxID=91359 RepID=UPI00047F3F00|nr:YjfK family protein [Enterovibrio calviensis]